MHLSIISLRFHDDDDYDDDDDDYDYDDMVVICGYSSQMLHLLTKVTTPPAAALLNLK